MNVWKKPAVAAAVAAVVLVGGLFLGANRSAAQLIQKTETMFDEGVDGSGYGIRGLLADRVEYAGYLNKVAVQYDALAEEVQAVTEACQALRDGTPRALYEANLALTDAVTALNLAMDNVQLSEQHEQYRTEYTTELTSYNQKIAHLAGDYNAAVEENRRTLSGFPVSLLAIGSSDALVEASYG